MTTPPKRRRPSLDELARGVAQRDRSLLSRAITLIESTQPDHAADAQELLQRLLPRTGSARRVGVSGVPGVGKSTFLDVLGRHLTARGHHVAVLAVDPSSQVTGGSILGDKTRMEQLSRDPNAYIRPTPASNAAGGVAHRTREASLLCEAAGYDIVLIETIGVGQSEVAVANMVDTFLLLALAGAGDELQGIKRGIMELADVIAIHKADGENLAAAERARTEYTTALRFLRHGHGGWSPPVLTASSRLGTGLDDVWAAVERHREALGPDGLATKRREQAQHWFDDAVAELLERDFTANPAVASALPELRRRVRDGTLQPTAAARQLMAQRG